MGPRLAFHDRIRPPACRYAGAAALLGLSLADAARAAEQPVTEGSSSLWLGLVLLLLVAGALAWNWRRRAPSAAATQRRRNERRRGERRRDEPGRGPSGFASTHQDSALDTVLDPRVQDPPRRLGHYLIERDIGRGAMGLVLLGRDDRSGAQVAIKTMALGREFHGEALDEARERFFREAETAGRLQHPDIVAIRETGEQDGTAYIAMELLAGRDLSVDAQPTRLLPVPVVVAIGARVARALAYAHRQGVTHRDIKPANIMVDPASGMVKVTDFGIARIIDSTQTRTGLVLGTPSFMSPEQMAGARSDGRSDLYALGVTLFQLLTGCLPHRADSMAALLHAIGNDVAPDVRSLRPELPPALADVVALALEKRPEVRYADGDVMAADLAAVLAQLEDAADQAAPLPVQSVTLAAQDVRGAAAPP